MANYDVVVAGSDVGELSAALSVTQSGHSLLPARPLTLRTMSG